MTLQEEIAAELSDEKIGNVYRTIIDREEGDYYIGRTEADSPEIDCEVLIRRHRVHPLTIGQFYNVRIIDAEEFDLYGEVEDF